MESIIYILSMGFALGLTLIPIVKFFAYFLNKNEG